LPLRIDPAAGQSEFGSRYPGEEEDLTLKANAVALCEVGQPRSARSWKEDKGLMTFLKPL
jgi:hypothetical protein